MPAATSPRHRAAIDALDREILARLNERARARAGDRRAEGRGRARIGRSARRRCSRALAARNPGPLPDDAVTGVFREIMSACLRARADAARRVPRARRHVQPCGGRASISARSSTRCRWPTIDDVFRAVESGQTDYAVVPVENSTEGAVGRTLDLMCTTDLSICGEVKLRVAAEPAVERGRARRGDARLFARAVARAVRAVAREAPAGGAARRRREQRRGRAARRGRSRAPPRSRARTPAAIYGLAMLAPHIEDEPNNTTRFWVLGRQQVGAVGSRRDVARDVVPQSARRRVPAAGAARAPRRVDVALRVAPGAHRPVGVPVLRRPRRPSRRPDASPPRSASSPHKAPFLKLLGSYPAALD